MKKTIALLITLVTVCTLNAQNVHDGKMMFLYGKHASADRIFSEIVKTNPSDADSWYWLVRNSLTANESEQAKKYAASIPADIQENPYILVAKGSVLLNENDSVAASTLFDKALGTKRKKDPFIQLAIAAAYNDVPKSNHQIAVDLLEAAKKREDKNAEILTALGDAYRWVYNGSSSYIAYKDAIKADEKYADALFKIGKIFQTQNNTEMFLQYFNQALDADSNYAPAYYELYWYYYTSNKASDALTYLKKYMAHADKKMANEYQLADMLLINKQYNESIAQANKILAEEEGNANPTIYRLMAHAYNETGNLAKSENYLNTYFAKQHDSLKRASDYELLATIYEKTNRDSMALNVYKKAFYLQNDSTAKLKYAKKLAIAYKNEKDYANEAIWDEQVYLLKKDASNVDLYNWGIASYYNKDYEASDSVFAIYEEKYPKHVYGYYWRARSNEAIDTTMEKGIAVPHYLKLIDVAVTDTSNSTNKRWLVQAYSYVAAYKANTEKDYEEAIDYFDKALELSPENTQIARYKEMLEKRVAKDKENGHEEEQTKSNR